MEPKQRLEENRLPADLKEQILAQLQPPEEREQLLRELKGEVGLSSGMTKDQGPITFSANPRQLLSGGDVQNEGASQGGPN
jgi:hypothetical protein